MKIAIVGSRKYLRLDLVRNYLIENFKEDDILVSGGADGVDLAAENAFKDNFNKKPIIFYPNWDEHGRGAGFARNTLIMDAAMFIVCFWDGESHGCMDTIKKAKKAGKPYEIYGPNGERLR